MPQSELEHIKGTIERITFHSEQTGFCVLRVKSKSQKDLVTVIANTASIAAGEFIECHGAWINDKQHGLQFKANTLTTITPTTKEGIEKYLGSGMVKGIGPHFAKKLVRAFGEDVFNVIETTPQRLTELPGIGKKRQLQVTEAWQEQKEIRNIMVFLQSHGVGTARSVRIYKKYGNLAIETVKNNPYVLAHDIHGIGFKTADSLALQLGIPQDSLIRAQAGVKHVLQSLCDHGHCAAELQTLIKASHTLLNIPHTTIEQAIQLEIADEHLIADTIKDIDCIYPVALYTAEQKAAAHIQRLNTDQLPWKTINIPAALKKVEKTTQLQLGESQQHAIQTALQSKLTIITGGPGVGKTTIINSLIQIISKNKLTITLCAPTGRAAKRMMETTGLPAKTIHRLLDFDPTTNGFKHHQDHQLITDLLIIDECSMIDITLFNHLLKAIPDHTAIIFSGDIDQLPSVGSGAVLSDLIQSQTIKTVKLTEIYRQAKHSSIITNAHRINQGTMPIPNEAHHDFFTLYEEHPEAIHSTLLDIVADRLPNHYQCNPAEDIQVLSPMNRGGLGTHSLNIELQRRLNPTPKHKITRFGSTFSPNDKVIQTTNNYDKEIFNGDIGFIETIDMEEGYISIRFDDRLIDYTNNELDEIRLAYAISIHKSQGSEFPIVVIPLATQHYTLLARNLLYTGITRGKQLVVLIGQKKAIQMAVNNNKETCRLTKLSERLQDFM